MTAHRIKRPVPPLPSPPREEHAGRLWRQLEPWVTHPIADLVLIALLLAAAVLAFLRWG